MDLLACQRPAPKPEGAFVEYGTRRLQPLACHKGVSLHKTANSARLRSRARLYLALTGFASALALVSGAHAQSISGIKIGDNVSTLSRLGMAPEAKNQFGPFDAFKWTLPDDNILSITAERSSGTIVYIENDWGGGASGRTSDYPSFSYGKTSLSDIRRTFGSNGFAFSDRSGVAGSPDGGIVEINSYELAAQKNVTATFFTAIGKLIVDRLRSHPQLISKLGDFATLDSLVLGDTKYLETIWGKRIQADAGYRKIPWLSTVEQGAVGKFACIETDNQYKFILSLDKKRKLVAVNGRPVDQAEFDSQVIWFGIETATGHVNLSAFNRSNDQIITHVTDAKTGKKISSMRSTCTPK